MAVYFSDHMAVSTANTTLVEGYKAHAGIKHARTRTTISRATGLFLDADVVRMITLKSSDRLIGLELATDGACSAGAVDVGIYLSGDDHDGAEEDEDIFATAVTVSTETDLIEIFTERTSSILVGGIDRGKTMWEIVTLGGGTNHTSDPNINFDLCLVPTTSLTVLATELTLKAIYTSGD